MGGFGGLTWVIPRASVEIKVEIDSSGKKGRIVGRKMVGPDRRYISQHKEGKKVMREELTFLLSLRYG